MSENSSNDTGTILGKILAAAILHEFPESSRNATRIIQHTIGKLKNYANLEEIKFLFAATEASYHALVCACLDKVVLDELTMETKECLSKLGALERVIVQSMYLKMTGQDFTRREKSDRWANPLWNLRTTIRKYLELSPTEVTTGELLQVLKDVFIPCMNTLREHVSKNL